MHLSNIFENDISTNLEKLSSNLINLTQEVNKISLSIVNIQEKNDAIQLNINKNKENQDVINKFYQDNIKLLEKQINDINLKLAILQNDIDHRFKEITNDIVDNKKEPIPWEKWATIIGILGAVGSFIWFILKAQIQETFFNK